MVPNGMKRTVRVPHWSDEAHLGRHVGELERESQSCSEDATLTVDKDQNTVNH